MSAHKDTHKPADAKPADAEQRTVSERLNSLADRLERLSTGLIVVSDQLKQAFAEIRVEVAKIKLE